MLMNKKEEYLSFKEEKDGGRDRKVEGREGKKKGGEGREEKLENSMLLRPIVFNLRYFFNLKTIAYIMLTWFRHTPFPKSYPTH